LPSVSGLGSAGAEGDVVKRIEVGDIRRRALGSEIELSAAVAGTSDGGQERRLWFRFPAELDAWLTDTSEPFVAALLPSAMLMNKRLCVDGSVSPLFRSGCEQIMDLYHAWDSRLRRIDFEVSRSTAALQAAVANGCFFTCGVDSFYTVLKNLERQQGDSRITHLFFVRGHGDCSLANDVLFENLRATLKKVSSALNLALVTPATNVSSYIPAPAAAWDWAASSSLAAVGLCLAQGLRRMYIPAGDTYSTLSRWGSHPLIDPLWSTEGLEFRHDGCEAFRSQKLDWYVARSRVALESLRVCGYELTGKQNCGGCEKCMRTMIALAALGVAAPSGLFARKLDPNRVRQLDGGSRVIRYYLRDNLRLLSATGRAPEIADAVRDALKPSLPRWLARNLVSAVLEFDRRFFNGKLRLWALSKARDNAQSLSDLRISPWKWAIASILRTTRIPSSRVAPSKESAR
jgi:hypothetical protein